MASLKAQVMAARLPSPPIHPLRKPSRDKLPSMRCRDRVRARFSPQSSRASNSPTIDLRPSRTSLGPRCAIATRPLEILYQEKQKPKSDLTINALRPLWGKTGKHLLGLNLTGFDPNRTYRVQGTRVYLVQLAAGAFFSISSSALMSNVAGTSMPSILAVLRFMTNSKRVGWSIGSSPGSAPFRILST